MWRIGSRRSRRSCRNRKAAGSKGSRSRTIASSRSSRYTLDYGFWRSRKVRHTMLVVMKAQATQEEIQNVCEHIEQLGFRAHPLPGATRTEIGITGNQGEIDRGNLEELSGVAEVIRGSKP